MKRVIIPLSISMFLLHSVDGVAGTAQARLWCESLKFHQAVAMGDETLDLSSVSGPPNGELLPYSGDIYASGFMLDFSGVPIYGTMYVPLPPVADANRNGFDDFFEVSEAASGTTSGSYTTDIGGGKVTATWNRPAGAKDGNCTLKIQDNTYGWLGDFNHVFELIEFRGAVSYISGTSNVTGIVNLKQTGATENVMAGPFNFRKYAADPFNKLMIQSGTWTNGLGNTFVYSTNNFLREAAWPTNYYGYMDFEDGELNTAAADYTYWILSIDDNNDANHNSIPDFTDNVAVKAPQLGISFSGQEIILTISGDSGKKYQLQDTLTLPPIDWRMVETITTTNAVQSLKLPISIDNSRWWRLVVQ